MLVPKKDVDATHQKFKQFKKFSLELYQKQYHIYENELILTPKVKGVPRKTIDDISNKIETKKEAPRPMRSLKFKVKETQSSEKDGPFKNCDFNYNQSINLPINEKMTFHLNTNLQSLHDFTLFSVAPGLSYRVRHTSYRVVL